MHPRLRAVADLTVPDVRELAGRHEYDGVVQDLSDTGTTSALSSLGGSPLDDPTEEAHVAAHEAAARLSFETLRVHHRNPLVHLNALDLSCYDRDYAPAAQRDTARLEHLRQWPAAVDVAVTTLDEVPAAVAAALLPTVRGLSLSVPEASGEVGSRARTAVQRLETHLAGIAESGTAELAIGRQALEQLMTTGDGVLFDVDEVTARAERERARLWERLAESTSRLSPGVPTSDVVARLVADCPAPDQVLDEARATSEEALEFTRQHELAPVDGELVVEESPPSRRWAVAMMSWAAPYERDAASAYSITLPDPSWAAAEQQQWLSLFSRTTLPAITVHEVAPGHFSHGRSLRRCQSDASRTLQGAAFAEGWAHYTEELCLDLGFRVDDPRFAVGVCLEALCRVVRLESAVGIHCGAFDVDEATRRFEEHALLGRAGARAEAQRATFDPGYGCYTWGKWAVQDASDAARAQWGDEFSLPRFHQALLSLGSPPLALMGAALDR